MSETDVSLSEATDEQIQLEVMRRTCVALGHPPYNNIFKDGKMTHAVCECGTVSWVPHE